MTSSAVTAPLIHKHDDTLGVFTVLATCFVSSGLLGVFPLFASATLGLCAFLTWGALVAGARMPKAGLSLLLYYAYAATSAIVFGGGQSLSFATMTEWFQGEGRVFLTFWPALLVLVFTGFTANLAQRLDMLFFGLALGILSAVALRIGWDIRLFSSHHGAGSLAASIFLYMLFACRHRPSSTLLIGLLCAGLALLGSGSRTAVLACAIGVGVTLALSRDWRAVGFVAAIGGALALAMPILFEHHYDRLLRAGAKQTYVSMAVNFYVASHSRPPVESQSAYGLRNIAVTEGNANLAIRGFLWGRAWGEFSASPIFGIGFGRYNDGARQFTDLAPVVRPVVEARTNNPAQHTAHNSVLHILAELGLVGFLLIMIPARQIWLIFRRIQRATTAPGLRFWADLGQSIWVFLLASSVTQHALGAPIFGLSAILLLCTCYAVLESSLRGY